MPWYDLFSTFYDHTVELVYRRYRPKIVEAAQLRPGDSVLDLACGTGPNQPYLREAVGEAGYVFGVDFSRGMLSRARKRGRTSGGGELFLLERDARKLQASELSQACGEPVQLRGVVVALGLSVIPDWENVFAATFNLLPPGGRYVIFDIYADRWVPQTSVVSRVAQADPYRESWRPLERDSEGFRFDFLPGSPHVHGGRPFLASGCSPGGK
jgi:ubiquinone/menaquinone biosynthesis C-methylase UbiE